MPEYRRWYVPGGTYFFTLVTCHRRAILCGDVGRRCLHEAIHAVQDKLPVTVVAIVLLPDHIHSVWTLPADDARYSLRWKQIKEGFTRRFLDAGGTEQQVSRSRSQHSERGVWQRRFWEHTVQDEEDLKRCVDYVHWNPKKHGYVSSVCDWPWSSFHRFVKQGEYEICWGADNPTPGYNAPEWGE
jgi:putative transposase